MEHHVASRRHIGLRHLRTPSACPPGLGLGHRTPLSTLLGPMEHHVASRRHIGLRHLRTPSACPPGLGLGHRLLWSSWLGLGHAALPSIPLRLGHRAFLSLRSRLGHRLLLSLWSRLRHRMLLSLRSRLGHRLRLSLRSRLGHRLRRSLRSRLGHRLRLSLRSRLGHRMLLSLRSRLGHRALLTLGTLGRIGLLALLLLHGLVDACGHLRMLLGKGPEPFGDRACFLVLAGAVEFLQFAHHRLHPCGVRRLALGFRGGGLCSRILPRRGHRKKQQPGGYNRNQSETMECWFHGKWMVRLLNSLPEPANSRKVATFVRAFEEISNRPPRPDAFPPFQASRLALDLRRHEPNCSLIFRPRRTTSGHGQRSGGVLRNRTQSRQPSR